MHSKVIVAIAAVAILGLASVLVYRCFFFTASNATKTHDDSPNEQLLRELQQVLVARNKKAFSVKISTPKLSSLEPVVKDEPIVQDKAASSVEISTPEQSGPESVEDDESVVQDKAASSVETSTPEQDEFAVRERLLEQEKAQIEAEFQRAKEFLNRRSSLHDKK